MDTLKEIEQAIDYIVLRGPGFLAELRQGSFNAISATDLKRQAERLTNALGEAALELAKADARNPT